MRKRICKLTAIAIATALVLPTAVYASETETPESAEEAVLVDESEEDSKEAEATRMGDVADILWEITNDMDLEEALKLEKRNYKLIQSMEPLFDTDSYKDYSRAIATMKSHEDQESLDAAIEARNNLIQTDSMADRIWYIWDGEAPIIDGESYTEEELDASSMDGYGSQPIIIKYLLDDPSEAKGNIVIVAGGGMQARSNNVEGYPVAERFNELGYNAFLLQRRVQPYSDMDIYMDYQRAVRMVRYYAEKEGWGGTNMIAGNGYSGGGATLMGEINYCYGDLTPADEGVSAYVPDEIDAVSSDLDVALVIYGARELDTENDNLPAFYICIGSEDSAEGVERSNVLYDSVKDKVPALLHIIEGAEHGYGVGINASTGLPDDSIPEECLTWPNEADEFMQENLGHSGAAGTGTDAAESANEEAGSGEETVAADDPYPDIPAEYTKVLTYFGTYGFGDAEITIAMSDDDSQIYYSFICFDEDQIMEGTVEDGVVNITYDLTGFVSGDAQQMYEDALASGEEWVSR